jgi:hypothetical protein
MENTFINFCALSTAKGMGLKMNKNVKIRGSLYYLGNAFSSKNFSEELDAEQAIDFDILWLSGYMFRYESLKNEQIIEYLETIFSEADNRGMRVIVEIMGTADWYKIWDCEGEIAKDKKIINILIEKFTHHKSFFGFYLGYEVYITRGNESIYCKELFKNISKYCHEKHPESMVCISPFFILDKYEVLGPYPYAEPEEYCTYWNSMLEDAEIDVVMLQDSGEHTSFITIEDRRPFFEAVKKACDKQNIQLWANIELGEIDVKNFEELRDYRGGYGCHEDNAKMEQSKWTGIELNKLDKKIKLGLEYCTNLVSWGYQQFMSPFADRDFAKDYYNAYKKYIGK